LTTTIAILTSADVRHGFRGNRGNFRDLIRAARNQRTLAYLVTAPALLRAMQRPSHLPSAVSGFIYDESRKQWRKSIFPFPKVVYNRMPTRADERKKHVQLLIRRLLDDPRVSFFNPHFFDKSLLARWIAEDTELKSYLPSTEILRGERSFTSMVERHQEVFLKPVHGKAGSGMMQVGKRHANEWYLKRQKGKHTLTRTFTDGHQLWLAIKTIINRKPYVMQQFVRLAQINGAVFDLRLLLQKNSVGQWSVTGIGARVAGKHSLTTHVPKGGYIASPQRILQAKLGREQTRKILLEVGKLGVRLARHIELKSGELLGEMSMDIGLDRHYRRWFFEANARPMKFDEPAIRKRSLRKWVRFCQTIAKPN
jgi:hypothetical protein